MRQLAVVFALCSLSFGQAWSGILAPDRAITWENNVGIPGGIPTGYTDCVTSACNTVSGGTVNPATLNAACTSAPDNSIIELPAVFFNINAATFCNRSNVYFNGVDPVQTHAILNGFNWFLGQDGQSGQGGTYQASVFTATNWTGGLTRGSKVLTFVSTTGMAADENIVLDQHNAAWVHVDGQENGSGGHCYPGNSCGRAESPLGFGGNWDVRAEMEMVRIVSVDSATQITIADPGVLFTHDGSLAPQAFFWSCDGTCPGGASSPHGNIRNLGLRNIGIDANGLDFAVRMSHCDYCVVENVSLKNIARAGLYSSWSLRPEFENNYIAANNQPGGPTQYGIELLNVTLPKIENNIIFGVTSSVLIEGSCGGVIGYNYIQNTSSGNAFADIDTHLAHNCLQLWEGNVAARLGLDNSWGSASQITLNRNYASGKSPNKNAYLFPIQIGAHNNYMNMTGNVLGTVSVQTNYQYDDLFSTGCTNDHTDGWSIWLLGFWNFCDQFPTPTDSLTRTSLMRWKNFDTKTYADNGSTNGIRACTGAGVGNPACTGSETASTDPTFPGLASPSATLPPSFYTGVTSVHTNCGTGLKFWKDPNTGTCPTYPPIGFDVICTSNCIANTATHVAKIPAQLCYENSAKDGSGFLTAFNARNCYANDPIISGNSGPAPASGLTAVTQ